MTQTGYVDLHVHYIPDVDDGVRTLEDGIALCQGLGKLGYERVVATPHIRTAMFENGRENLMPAFQEFAAAATGQPGMPELGLAAEHFCDDVFWQLFESDKAMPYPGGHAVLVEFPEATIPLGIEQRFFEMRVRGVAPVLAHPERYRALFRNTDPVDRMLEAGLMLQLDLMSLAGHYGRRPRKAAERMLESGAYYLACSDTHKPKDLETLGQAIERLFSLVDDDYARQLLGGNPKRVLAGDIDL